MEWDENGNPVAEEWDEQGNPVQGGGGAAQAPGVLAGVGRSLRDTVLPVVAGAAQLGAEAVTSAATFVPDVVGNISDRVLGQNPRAIRALELAKNVHGSLVDQTVQQFEKAREDEERMPTHGRPLLAPALRRGASIAAPGVAPFVIDTIEKGANDWNAGNPAGALAEATTSLVAPELAMAGVAKAAPLVPRGMKAGAKRLARSAVALDQLPAMSVERRAWERAKALGVDVPEEVLKTPDLGLKSSKKISDKLGASAKESADMGRQEIAAAEAGGATGSAREALDELQTMYDEAKELGMNEHARGVMRVRKAVYRLLKGDPDAPLPTDLDRAVRKLQKASDKTYGRLEDPKIGGYSEGANKAAAALRRAREAVAPESVPDMRRSMALKVAKKSLDRKVLQDSVHPSVHVESGIGAYIPDWIKAGVKISNLPVKALTAAPTKMTAARTLYGLAGGADAVSSLSPAAQRALKIARMRGGDVPDVWEGEGPRPDAVPEEVGDHITPPEVWDDRSPALNPGASDQPYLPTENLRQPSEVLADQSLAPDVYQGLTTEERAALVADVRPNQKSNAMAEAVRQAREAKIASKERARIEADLGAANELPEVWDGRTPVVPDEGPAGIPDPNDVAHAQLRGQGIPEVDNIPRTFEEEMQMAEAEGRPLDQKWFDSNSPAVQEATRLANAARKESRARRMFEGGPGFGKDPVLTTRDAQDMIDRTGTSLKDLQTQPLANADGRMSPLKPRRPGDVGLDEVERTTLDQHTAYLASQLKGAEGGRIVRVPRTGRDSIVDHGLGELPAKSDKNIVDVFADFPESPAELVAAAEQKSGALWERMRDAARGDRDFETFLEQKRGGGGQGEAFEGGLENADTSFNPASFEGVATVQSAEELAKAQQLAKSARARSKSKSKSGVGVAAAVPKPSRALIATAKKLGISVEELMRRMEGRGKNP